MSSFSSNALTRFVSGSFLSSSCPSVLGNLVSIPRLRLVCFGASDCF